MWASLPPVVQLLWLLSPHSLMVCFCFFIFIFLILPSSLLSLSPFLLSQLIFNFVKVPLEAIIDHFNYTEPRTIQLCAFLDPSLILVSKSSVCATFKIPLVDPSNSSLLFWLLWLLCLLEFTYILLFISARIACFNFNCEWRLRYGYSVHFVKVYYY